MAGLISSVTFPILSGIRLFSKIHPDLCRKHPNFNGELNRNHNVLLVYAISYTVLSWGPNSLNHFSLTFPKCQDLIFFNLSLLHYILPNLCKVCIANFATIPCETYHFHFLWSISVRMFLLERRFYCITGFDNAYLLSL